MTRTPPAESVWTEERTRRLLKMAGGTHSASAIARLLGGGIGRNAVLGKLHRLRRAGAVVPSRQEEPRPAPLPRRKAKVPKAPPPPPPPAPAAPAKPAAPGAPARPPDASRAFLAVPEPARPKAPGAPALLADLRNLEGGCRHCRFILGDVGGPEATRYCGRRTIEPGKPYCEEHAARCFQLVPRDRRAA